MDKRLTLYIAIGMALGVAAGQVAHLMADSSERAAEIAAYFSIVSTLFLRLVKMIIAPLVFATLVTGIAHLGDSSALGRIGVRAIGWFLCASLVSLSLGLLLVNLFQPGVGLGLPLPADGAASAVGSKAPSFAEFVTHIVPSSMIDAMATNSILQIVVFSLLTGVALTAIGETGAPLVRGIEALVELMLQITAYVMRCAPVAVFAAIAAVVTTEGFGILATFGKLIGQIYIGFAILWLLLALAGLVVLGPRIWRLLRYIREPLLLAFSTASSEAAYPKTLEQLDRFGVPRRIASFVLPLGYSFNLDGSMMYATFAIMFIAQAYGVDLSLVEQITILLVLMVTSKGVAGVPRASLVVVAATLAYFDLPEAGLLVILGVDQFLDMGRSATNVVGNAVATAVVAKWEGKLDAAEAAEQEPLHAPSHKVHDGRRGLDLAPDAITEAS